jgi:hypothetical protein
MMTRNVLFVALIVLLTIMGFATCGDDSNKGCPGKVCTNCSASGDCNMTCTPPKVNFCGHFGLFEDQSLRCSFCENPDFKF